MKKCMEERNRERDLFDSYTRKVNSKLHKLNQWCESISRNKEIEKWKRERDRE